MKEFEINDYKKYNIKINEFKILKKWKMNFKKI